MPEEVAFSDVESEILKWSQDICRSYLKEAEHQLNSFCLREGLSIPSVAPRTKIILGEKNEISIVVKMPVRNSEVAEVEQKLSRKFAEQFLIERRAEQDH